MSKKDSEKTEPPVRMSTRLEYKITREPIEATIKDISIEGNDPEDHDPRCEKSPTKEHQFIMSSTQALVIGSTCYHCIHCGKHKDVYHHHETPLFSMEELDERSD